MDFDLIVIGSGPAGYVGAIRAAQLGLRTAIVEMGKPGGVCLNVGCIPTKALIHKAHEYQALESLEKYGVSSNKSHFDFSGIMKFAQTVSAKLSKSVAYLIKKNAVQWIQGKARFLSPFSIEVDQIDGKHTYSASHFLIATGSRPRNLPGLSIDENQILSSTGALSLNTLPRSIAIIGAGAIGVEFAYIFRAFGTEVYLIEVLPRILPLEDAEAVSVLSTHYTKRGIRIDTSTKVIHCEKTESVCTLTLEKNDGQRETIETEKVLLSVGRVINTDDLGLEALPLKTERGFIPVDSWYRTAMSHIYAAGDVVNTPLLAHVASKEAVVAVEHMVHPDKNPSDFKECIPSCIYSEPEIGSFGLQEETLKANQTPYEKSTFPFRGVGKSVAIERPEGFIKVLIDPETRRILGATIVGAQATELLHEIMLAKHAGLPIETVADMVHAHPTLSEGIMEVSKLATGEAINI
jgi:dihydrolipoamide dehydrogenase